MRRTSSLVLAVVLLTGCVGTRAALDAPIGEDPRTEQERAAGEPDPRPTRGDWLGDAAVIGLGVFGFGAVGLGARQVLRTKRRRRATDPPRTT